MFTNILGVFIKKYGLLILQISSKKTLRSNNNRQKLSTFNEYFFLLFFFKYFITQKGETSELHATIVYVWFNTFCSFK
jgi:hypothetical protein